MLDSSSQLSFKRIKALTVPILEYSSLTPQNIPRISALLSDLIKTLQDVAKADALTPSLISYTFFPISSVLQRNDSGSIPDQILEKIYTNLQILCESWWWDFDVKVWEQLFMLCSAVIGDLGTKGTGKVRDDETKAAASRCLWTILRPRNPNESLQSASGLRSTSHARLESLQIHAKSEQFIPILGQTLNALLSTADSKHLDLQISSLRNIGAILELYSRDDFIPSVLPGTVSLMTRVALATNLHKAWANGDVVNIALDVLREIIVRAIGDDICTQEGALRSVDTLEDLTKSATEPLPSRPPLSRYSTPRTTSWLNGTAAQLHIAINTLGPLLTHPSSSALIGLSDFATSVLSYTTLTLPQTQPLLLSFLLSLSNSNILTVSQSAHDNLARVLTPGSKGHTTLLPILTQTTKENLSALPRLLLSRDDLKIRHVTGLVAAVCNLSVFPAFLASTGNPSPVSKAVGKLLGPSGGIEKWGWSLLAALEFEDPLVSASSTSSAQLMLESDPQAIQPISFPSITLSHLAIDTHHSLVHMLRSLGQAGGKECLFSVEWFARQGYNGQESQAIAALWCGCRLLEGIVGVTLESVSTLDLIRSGHDQTVQKVARGIARNIAELWEATENLTGQNKPMQPEPLVDDGPLVEYRRQYPDIRATVGFAGPASGPPRKSTSQPHLHRMISLHFLSVTASILQARFTPLLLHCLYPVLQSIISTNSHLASTGLAALQHISICASYASPANMLLSNFDYALDSVSRRLSHRWLDIEASEVLAVLVRLVGDGIVERAGDIVEACFDRLDEFHGYDTVVEGLIAALQEVVTVIEMDTAPVTQDQSTRQDPDLFNIQRMLNWCGHRFDPEIDAGEDQEYGTAPRKASGDIEEQGETETLPSGAGDTPNTPSQALASQIISRSLYFLTHKSETIRLRILSLLSTSASVLPASLLLPSIHQAWPFVLNRLADPQPFVVREAVFLVESLTLNVGSYMYRKVWDDVWPRFRTMLAQLDEANVSNALARKGVGAVGTKTAYAHSHRLYASLLRTMAAAVDCVDSQDAAIWHAIIAFRKFLHQEAHEELQKLARILYSKLIAKNRDSVWLALASTSGCISDSEVVFLIRAEWKIDANLDIVLS